MQAIEMPRRPSSTDLTNKCHVIGQTSRTQCITESLLIRLLIVLPGLLVSEAVSVIEDLVGLCI